MKRILYIEDSVTSQLIVRRMLSGTNEVTIAPMPRAGNLLLEQHSYDLVITDFLFPQADALEVVVPLRQKKSATELPIIAVSSSMDMALVSRLLKAGVNACLAKPFKPAEFSAFVESYQNMVSTAYCFQWFANGVYHEHCPELNQHLTGKDRDDLSNRMQALLQEYSSKGTVLGFTAQERVRSYLLQPGVPVATGGNLQSVP